MPNRIKELRELRGLSVDDLAEKCHTSGPQIRRLENGARRLTEGWMRRIAAALDVRPTDLLREAALAELDAEIEIASARLLNGAVARALESKNLVLYEVKCESVQDSGLHMGSTFLADHSQQALAALKSGDVVVVHLKPRASNAEPVLAIRIFVAPDLLVTNRPGSNVAMKLSDPVVEAKILAVMVEGSTEQSH